MNYRLTTVADLGAVGEVMNPLMAQPQVRLLDASIALGPTTVINDPYAGMTSIRKTGLDGWRDAMDVFTAAAFLFPE